MNKLLPIKPIPIKPIPEFPFTDYTFDDVTLWQMIQCLTAKMNETVEFVNDVVENKIEEIVKEDLEKYLLQATYEEENQAMIVSLEERS